MTSHGHPPGNSFSLPDSEIACAAIEFAADVSPAMVYNHCLRSYVFARELAAAAGLRADADYDDELVLLACVLHDLGVTDVANGDQRFEVDGADAASTFLRERGLDEGRVETVWTAIALHTSIGLAHRFGPTATVAQMGIGADIAGAGRDSLLTGFADRVHAAWPRHDLGYALAELIAGQVQHNPAKGAPMTFPGLVHQLIYSPERQVTWFDVVESAGWGDRPTVAHATEIGRR